ncbi:superfamily II DNA or RNA helicase [Paenibacillus shirakamiensis]|uniref:Superfamily II DNA or RNA helicase n=1 Tax=Paenibacillus shirakamiensis TaxID=1265935 RepID=A0ABS4JIK2_9BACL|nr:DEAD/DEAH box helicase [Paenibacillus shirakamiensis]MBP2001537.1 superfamily II DNA or RNA helicase [Paenibacillus shirakamiensis]
MNFQLSERTITLLCGPQSFERGTDLYQEGQVTFTLYRPNARHFEATVKGSDLQEVTVILDANHDVSAKCSCPSYYTSFQYCEHVAAVLLDILHAKRYELAGPDPMNSSPQTLPSASSLAEHSPSFPSLLHPRSRRNESSPFLLADEVLGLFGNSARTGHKNRILTYDLTALDAEFICRPHHYGMGKYMLALELRVGEKRFYIVQKIREFLTSYEQRDKYTFTKHFSYIPELHYFHPAQDRVLRMLIDVHHEETMYRDTLSGYAFSSRHTAGDRLLLIPPSLWDTLLPLLLETGTVKVELPNGTFTALQVADHALPLRFGFDQDEEATYQLDVQGLDQLIILEAYGIVLYEGKLLKLPVQQCTHLHELKRMLDTSRQPTIQISKEQMEPFMEKVVPALMKMGEVHVAEAVSDRLMQAPLKARLYLDRIRDRLIASLEFQYGDIVIYPLQDAGERRGEDRILIRDGEQERRILAIMQQSHFAQTESGYFIDDEEKEFDFLHHTIPDLEKLLVVYATTAVKVRVLPTPSTPSISVHLEERTNWLELRFKLDGIPEDEVKELLHALEAKRKYYRLPTGSLLPLDTKEWQGIGAFMKEIGIRKPDIKGPYFRVPALQALHVMDPQAAVAGVTFSKSLRQLLEHIRNPGDIDFEVPPSLAPILRDYQKLGYQWMKTLAHYQFGGILADDMGLGKTLQAITFLVSELPSIRSDRVPAIIVCPASLIYNWHNELRKFAPGLRAVIADGTKTMRDRVLKHADEFDVIITSYPLLRQDVDTYAKYAFHTLILDEAQAFKNHYTQTAQSVKKIDARYTFALTGTPVENSIEELWSIYNVVLPILFPSRVAFSSLSRETIARRIRPFLLRRLKTDVLKELPEKLESMQISELLPEQKKLYAAYLGNLREETLKHLKDDEFQQNRIKILAGLTRLRQLCCHPALFVEGYKGGSAKFDQLMEIIAECRSSGRRVLIFSQFTQMLGIIGRELGYEGIPYFYLDGQTPSRDRVELCDRFNEGEKDLFLISLKAGGTGLNLTGADTVILYDLWWNPAVEEQAADRAHRMGQKRVVQVIRLVTQDTVEDKMYELQQKKKDLIAEVIEPGQESISTLTEQEIRELLSL